MKITKFLTQINRLPFVFSIIIFGIVLNFILSYIITEILYINLESQNATELPKNMKIVFEVIIVPFFETALFQYLPIVLTLKTLIELKIISSYPIKYFCITTIISSFLFALIHTFSIAYFLVALIMGLYFGYITILSEFVRKKRVNVFMSVGLTHIIINLMAIIFD